MDMGEVSYVLGIDVGTTSVKSVLLDSEGALLASAMKEYALGSGPDGTCEVHPDVYWNIACLVIRELLATSGVDTESYLFGKLKSDYTSDFPNLIDRSNFTCRHKRLYPWIEELNQGLSNILNQGEDIYIVDSIPVPVCQIAREKRSKICRENFETVPDKGYSAVSKAY